MVAATPICNALCWTAGGFDTVLAKRRGIEVTLYPDTQLATNNSRGLDFFGSGAGAMDFFEDGFTFCRPFIWSIGTIGWYSSQPESRSYSPLFNLFYPDRADFIGFVSNLRSRAAMRRLAVAFRANSEFPLETAATFSFVPGVSWSDHRSFWRQGYRAVMITDTAFYRYRHYHQPSDTPNKLAYPEFTRATAGLFAAFSELGSKSGGRRGEARPP